MNKKSIRTLQPLVDDQLITDEQQKALEAVTDHFSFAITDQMYQLIDQTNPNDPIAKQFIPTTAELKISSREMNDPIGDTLHAPVPGIVHRHADRCLFTPVHVCPLYCRFCFRREKVGESAATLTPTQLDAAYDYIEKHSELWEVILTGGDPLILKPAQLSQIMQRLQTIQHVEVVRIHTRIPIVDSQRVTNELITALKIEKPVYVIIHANHPREMTPTAIAACARLVDAGIPLLSQSVLLKNINDNIDTLSELMRCFVKHRIKPYYLHHGDLARGTQHFRTSIAKGQALMKALHNRFSGLCQPTYVLDIPGGHGKSPIGPHYICQESEHHYRIQDCHDEYHDYVSDE